MNEKKLAKKDLLINVAEMYYIQGLSQEQIAKKINSSRSNVSRLLKLCVQQNIIEFKINKTTSRIIELENMLKDKYDLEHVMVIPSYENLETSKHEVGDVVAKYLQSILKDGSTVGIAWGTTLYNVVESFEIKIDQHKELNVYQLVGGVGTSSIDTDGLELTKKLSDKLGATAHVLNAPLLVQSKVLRDLLLEEPQIEEHFRGLKNPDIVLLGIGTNNPEHNAMYRASYISRDDALKLVESGAIADLAGYQINKSGAICDTHISEKIITTKLEDIRNAKIRIGTGVGIEKVDAIKSVLEGKYINVLATDEVVANAIL